MPTLLTLTLRDGTKVSGRSFGADVGKFRADAGAGEVVFATGMVGYPESLTDPSFAGQILVLTYPLVGNYGVPAKTKNEKRRTKNGGEEEVEQNFESDRIHVAGVVVSEYSEKYSHSAAVESLAEWLQREGIPAITGVDTRALTQLLREHGTILGRFETDGKPAAEWYDPGAENLVAKVTIPKPKFYPPSLRATADSAALRPPSPTVLGDFATLRPRGKKTVAILDCGMKLNILRSFLDRGVSVWHLPADHDLSGIEYDGLFISNGPGDPVRATATIATIKKALTQNKPIFGICLGNQLLALAAGAKTYKLPYGHRSQNQPVREVATGRCCVTSQNHGYAVDRDSLSQGWEVAYENINDRSVEGLRHTTKPFFSVQFHPEACPGPTDTAYLFDRFIGML